MNTFQVSAGYSLATGAALPTVTVTQTTVGQAPQVMRKGCRFPFRMATFWDVSQWGAGYIRPGSGSVILRHSDGACLDLSTGRVYTDSRFANKGV